MRMMAYRKAILLLTVLCLLVTESFQKGKRDDFDDILSLLEEGIATGVQYVKENQHTVRQVLSNFNLGNGFDIEEMVQNWASGSRVKSRETHHENILDLMQEFSVLMDSISKGSMDYEKIGNFVLRTVSFVADNPNTLAVIPTIVARNANLGPLLDINQASGSLHGFIVMIIKKFSEYLMDLPHIRRTGAAKMIHFITNATLEHWFGSQTDKRSAPLVNLGNAMYDMALHWNDDHSINPNRRSEFPDVTDVFLEIIKEPIHKLTIALRSAEEVAEILEDIPTVGDSKKKRDVGQLASSIRQAAVQARKLKGWSINSNSDDSLTYVTFESLPRFEKLVRDLRDDTGLSSEVSNTLKTLAMDVEDSIDRLVRMRRMIDHIKDWDGVDNFMVITQDIRDIIGGIPRFNSVSTSLSDLIDKLKNE